MEKKAICLVTRILRSHGISNCSAETFRLAKHDQTEAVVPMWYLLKDMIENFCVQHHKKRCLLQFTQHCNDDSNHHHHHDDIPLQHVVLFVQSEFHRLGYMSWDFYQLSQDDVSFGSRDLLLAFAWLLCHVDFVGLLLKRMTFSEQIKLKFTGKKKGGVARKIPPTWNIIDCVKYMILIHGKMILTCRQLHALQREQNRLTHKLYASTQGISLQPGLNHLMPAEAQLLHTSEEKLAFHLEDINSRIEDILKWKEFENAFWKWMESVIMLKAANSEKVLCEYQKGSEENKMTNSANLDFKITADVKLGLQVANKRLNEIFVQYGPYINNLDSIWHKKQQTLSRKEHSKIIMEFHRKVKKLDAQNNENSPKKLAFVHQATNQHRYCFDCPKSQLNNMVTCESNSKMIMKKKDSVEEDIVCVNKNNNILERKFEMELESISNEFQHLICIPVSN